MRSKRGALVALVMLLAGTGVLVAPSSVAPSTAHPAPESGSSDWRMVAVGSISVCGIRTTGRLYCWGYGAYLGNGASTDQPVPTEVAGGHTTWRTVSVGGETTCGIRAPGRLYCWGNNYYGTVGDGTFGTWRQEPTLVAGGFTDWTSVSAGGNSTCGRRANGRLYCWGRDHKGQLGNGLVQGGTLSPGLVAGGFTNWTSVAVGHNFACGRRANGRLYCWGYNVYGQLGNGNQSDQQSPALVAGGFTNWTMVSAGSQHTCGIRASGQLRCWGLGSNGQRGDGVISESVTTPAAVGGYGWTHVSAGLNHSCGRRGAGAYAGRLYCWGDHQYGQLGTGTSTGVMISIPAEVSGGATDWHSVAVGSESSCARTRSGRLWCWGLDNFGELGNGDEGTADDPSEVFAP